MVEKIPLLEIKKENKIFYKKYKNDDKKRYIQFDTQEPSEMIEFNEQFLVGSIIPNKLGYFELSILNENKEKVATTICKVVVAKPENQWIIN